MKITDDWLIANQTPRGAWKAKQLLAIGVAWPPAQGWKQRVIGREIGIEQQRVFESFAGSRPSVTGPAQVRSCGCAVPPWEDCEHTADGGRAQAALEAAEAARQRVVAIMARSYL